MSDNASQALTSHEAFMVALETAIQQFHMAAPVPPAAGETKEREAYVSDGFGVLGSVFGRYMAHVAAEQGYLKNNDNEAIVAAMVDGLKPHILGAFERKREEIGQ